MNKLKLWQATVTFEIPIVVAAETQEEAEGCMIEAAEDEYDAIGPYYSEQSVGLVRRIESAADLRRGWTINHSPYGDCFNETIADLLDTETEDTG